MTMTMMMSCILGEAVVDGAKSATSRVLHTCTHCVLEKRLEVNSRGFRALPVVTKLRKEDHVIVVGVEKPVHQLAELFAMFGPLTVALQNFLVNADVQRGYVDDTHIVSIHPFTRTSSRRLRIAAMWRARG